MPENLGTTTADERQKVHFRLMCVALKRLCLSSLICLKGVVSYTQAAVPQLHYLACRFFLPLHTVLLQFSFAFSSFLPVGFFIPASPSCVMHQSIPPAPCLSPGLLRALCPPCQSRGRGICKFYTARASGICQPQGNSRASDTHAVSYQNITTQKVLLAQVELTDA